MLKALFYWVSFLLEQGHHEESLRFLRKAAELSPNNPEYSFELVEAYHLKGDARAAVDHARLLVRRFPDHPGSYLNLGTGLKLDGRFDEAKPLFERSLKLATDAESAANRDLWAQAAFHLASILRKEGAFRKSIELLSQVVKERPEPAALLELSHGHIQNGDPEKALPLLEQAMSLDRGNPEPRFVHATALLKLGRIEEARKGFEIFERLQSARREKKKSCGQEMIPSFQPRVELTRFRGHIQSKEVKGGVHDGKKAAAVPAGVPPGDRGAGALGAIARGAGAGVRALGVGDPQVGQAGRSGRGAP